MELSRLYVGILDVLEIWQTVLITSVCVVCSL